MANQKSMPSVEDGPSLTGRVNTSSLSLSWANCLQWFKGRPVREIFGAASPSPAEAAVGASTRPSARRHSGDPRKDRLALSDRRMTYGEACKSPAFASLRLAWIPLPAKNSPTGQSIALYRWMSIYEPRVAADQRMCAVRAQYSNEL
jgi:hypothetical protein